jgi:electron transport complex protein RnfC
VSADADRPTISLSRFHGGLRLEPNKTASTGRPLVEVPVPRRLVHPLSQHAGSPSEPIVAVGERVLRMQPLSRSSSFISAPVHAGSSGVVVAIEEHRVAHPSGLTAPCVVIETDGEDAPWDGVEALADYTTLNPPALRARVRDSGIVGLGGAAFPTAVKLNVGGTLKALILNGAECEPYISCDDTLLRHRPQEVVTGAGVMLHALELDRCIIALEDDMPEAWSALSEAVALVGDPRIELVQVPAVYPEGGERQLITVLTGEEVPSNGFPADIGYLVHNVGTAAAVARAVLDGEPLHRRIVTVTGGGVARPGNVEVRFGTPIADVVAACGGYTERARHLLVGGAMMGYALPDDDVPVVKATNCILIGTPEDIAPRGPARPCIRCGECARACPAQLLPQQLFWHARADDFERAEEAHLFDCIECGCCDLVCPSHIPLTRYFRYAKAEIWSQARDRVRAEHAKRRYDNREARLEREREAKRRRLAERSRALNADATDETTRKAVIDEIMQRVRDKKDHRGEGDGD